MGAKLKAVDDESLLPPSVRLYNKIRPLAEAADEARIDLNEAKKEVKRAGKNKEVFNLCSKYKKKDILAAQSFKRDLDEMWAEFGFDDQKTLPLEATKPAA